MRIIHTSDWHLGLRLHQYDMHPHHEAFLLWLYDQLKVLKVDCLLISGDIFDQANPSNQALRLYYQFLHKVSGLGVKVIITGGNHDSVSLLNAPSLLLGSMGIEVRGGVPERPEDLLIPLDEYWVVAAIPFLRDKDLRNPQEEGPDTNRIQAIQEGIIRFFGKMAELSQEHYPEHQAIAMGHLFMQGAITSESERDIQIGNLAGVTVDQFPQYFTYYALGHIHKPQDLRKDGMIAYSGSPIPLSFSEGGQDKRLLMLETEGKDLNVKEITIPAFVRLQTLTSNMEEYKDAIGALARSMASQEVPLLIDIHIQENEMRGDYFYDLNEGITALEAEFPHTKVLHRRISILNVHSNVEDTLPPSTEEKITPLGLFNELIRDRSDSDQLRELFQAVLENIENETEEA